MNNAYGLHSEIVLEKAYVLRCDLILRLTCKNELNHTTYSKSVVSNGQRLIVFGCVCETRYIRYIVYALQSKSMCVCQKPKSTKRQQNKKSNDNSNFPIQPWSKRNHLRWRWWWWCWCDHNDTGKRKNRYIFEINPNWVKSITRNVKWETMCTLNCRVVVSASLFFTYVCVWYRKFCDMLKIYEAQIGSPGKSATIWHCLFSIVIWVLSRNLSAFRWLSWE